MKSKVHTISVPFHNLEKIAHIADVHIRLVKRHDEYREVFQTLYEDLLQTDLTNGIILVAGDIVHAKTDMSPEMIHLASDFFRSLSEIAPTIVVAGNHDMNLANVNRMDALSPIIENIGSKNLHYLRDSGVYKIADTQFGLFSIIGGKDKWPKADCLTTTNKIALYHGPVNNATTDVGFTITNRHVTPSIFAGYDMVLLGDIHKHQTLQQYNPLLGQPIIVYPGSLIQQSHGESLENHGWLEWNVPNRSFEFHEVANKYGFYTLTVVGNKIPNVTDMPENVRLRLFVENTDATTIKKVQASIRKKYNVAELTINRVVQPKNRTTSKTTDNLDFSDVANVDFQNKLIQTYLKAQYPEIDKDTLHLVSDINAQLNGKVEEEDMSRNVNWRPLHFTFDNMFSYGPNNEINFADMEGVYGLFSPNASGKTSSFDAMMFCLFDKTPRAFKATHIMNNRKSEFECQLKFEIDDTIYGIKRVGTRKKKGDVSVTVDFWREDENGERTSLNGEDRRATNAHIRTYIGDYDDFILTNLSVQNNGALFIDKGQSDRKDLLAQFMGINIFDRLYTLALDEMREVTGALKKFNRNDFTQNLATTQNKIEEHERSYSKFDEQLEDRQASLEKIAAKIRKLYEKKVPINFSAKDISKLETQYESFQSELRKAQALFSDQEAYEAEAYIEEDQAAGRLGIFKKDDTIRAYEEFRSLKKAENSVLHEVKILDATILPMQQKLKHLEEYQYDPNCKFCVENVFVKDAKNTKKELEVKTQERGLLAEKLSTIYLSLEKLVHAENNFNVMTQYEQEFADAKRKSQLYKSNLNATFNKIATLEGQILATGQKIKQYKDSIDTLEKNEKIQNQIDDLEKEQHLVQSEIRKLETSIRDIHGQIQVLKANKSEMIKAIRDAEQLEDTYHAYEYYTSAVNRDGVPYELISKVIPNIEAEINNILTQIVDFTIALEVDGKNINGKIVYDTDRIWPLELSSGMERFISSLAIRVALINVSNLPKSNFLIVDEGLGTLDADNLASMSMMFSILKSQFDFIVVISHLDSVRDIVDNLIEIRRERGFSQIQVA